MAGEAGFMIEATVTHGTEYLVSSRSDTRKAQAARRIGTEVITYLDFHIICAGRMAARPNPPLSGRTSISLPPEDGGRMSPREFFQYNTADSIVTEVRGIPDSAPEVSQHRRVATDDVKRKLDL